MSYDDSGMTKVTVFGTVNRDLSPEERLRRAVQETLVGQFELHGELGRGDDGSVVFLATEIASRRLAALRLSKSGGGSAGDEDWFVEVVRKLDASIPALESNCPQCGGQLKGWARFCRHCGADLSGVGAGSGPNTTSDDLLREVRAAARGRYEILGQMDRAEGGGIVYFAKDLKSKKLVALRLTRQNASDGGTEVFQLGVTRVMSDFQDSLGLGQSQPTHGAIGQPTLPPPSTSREGPAVPPTPPSVPAVGAPPPPPRPVVAEAGSVPADEGNARRLWMVVGAVAVLALIAVLLLRPRGPAAPVVAVDTTQNVPPAVDSGSFRVGVPLPAGGSVTVDGVGVEGDRVRVAVGAHTIVASAPGYQDVAQTMDVGANETVVFAPVFVPAKQVVQAPAPPPVAQRPRTPARTTPAPTTTPVTQPADPGPAPISSAPPRNTCTALFGKRDWAGALPKCQEEAQAGVTSSIGLLGRMYEEGRGTSRSPALAAQWYQRAADAGDGFAQYRLGLMTINGDGIRKDEKRGVDLLRKASDQDQADAMYHYARSLETGRAVRKDMNGALQWFQRSAELGNHLSQTKLGLLYSEGSAVARDDGTAAQWFKKAADQGFADAQYYLGQMYMTGRGVPVSAAEARKLFQAAASQGHSQARDALQRMK
jgi:Sel1 repeat